MESESGTNKVSDSGYSNSCSNSQSQRSGSSKSRHSESNSSKSSGYCGHPSTTTSSLEPVPEPISKRNKDREHKKSKKPTSIRLGSTSALDTPIALLDDNSGNSKITDCSVTCNVEYANNVNGKVINRLSTISAEEDDLPLSPLLAQIAKSAQINPGLDGDLSTGCNSTAIDANHNEDAEVNPTTDSDITDTPQGEPTCKALCQPEDGFCCVISMCDGVVLYTTPGLSTVLGFPKDMWLGRSFIEFVHQKDREIFATQITNGLAAPKQKDIRNSIFVNLRKYRGLKNSGFGIIEKTVSYKPFHLTITFRQVNDQIQNDSKISEKCDGMFLIIVAVPVYPIYKVPDESCNLSKFCTRHTANCTISHVDPDVVPNFGYFPQDMIGRCIFDFYHPADMPLLKEIYQNVMEKCKIPGTMFKSQPYRFLVQNGEYAAIETEWTSFVNPWTKKLEIVINHHRVIQGPSNPNVFDNPVDNTSHNISEEVLKKSGIIREEIQNLLDQLVQLESAKQQISQRCKDLASFMEILMDEVSKSNLKTDICHENNTSISVSNELNLQINGNTTQNNKDRDSVMLGEISPHHDYYDSKSSSETPPSYNQLNYNENIQRFFQSKPMTTISDDMNGPLQSTTDTDQEGKSSSAVQECSNQKCLSPIHGSGASGSGSGGNLSSESNPQMENGTTSGTNFSNDSYKAPHLTEALLLKHNEDMKNIMIKRHREQRSISKSERDGRKSYSKHLVSTITTTDKSNQYQNNCHGLKRSGSHSWEEDNHKVLKHQHQNESMATHFQTQENLNTYSPMYQSAANVSNNNNNNNSNNNNPTSIPINMNTNIYQQNTDKVNLWPPFSVTVTPFHTTQPCTTGIMSNPSTGYTTGMIPAVCYIPAPTGQTPREYPGPPVPGQFHVQYMPSMMYPTIFGASPIMYPPLTMVQPMTLSMQQPQQSVSNVDVTRNEIEKKTNVPSADVINSSSISLFQRPASQATSVKAEPGSAFGSIASASAVNPAMSECSRKDLTLQSVCSPGSIVVSPQDGETLAESANIKGRVKGIENIPLLNKTDPIIEVDEESSYSSFYSSFLKTDTGSGSNEDNNNSQDCKKDKKDEDVEVVKKEKPEKTEKRKTNPVRKSEPPWLENVVVTPELIYRYQIAVKEMKEILDSDLNVLKDIDQPEMVNNQLEQLYLEMELEGLSTKLSLEDGITSSSSSGEENINSYK